MNLQFIKLHIHLGLQFRYFTTMESIHDHNPNSQIMYQLKINRFFPPGVTYTTGLCHNHFTVLQ